MSQLYAYISTKQTADPYVPPQPSTLPTLSRDVSDGFYALQGGYVRVGQLAFYPVQKSVPFHLLCDGSEVPKVSFPELFEYLGDSQGTASDPLNFVLPNFVGAIEPATVVVPETVEAGTVTSEPSSEGTGQAGGSTNPAVTSGGRPPGRYAREVSTE